MFRSPSLKGYIMIDGKQYVWSELVKLRREQIRARAIQRQLTLFELRIDARLVSERTVAGRFLEPSLFTLLDGSGA